MPYKTPKGRLREAGALRVLELRREGKTYAEISQDLAVTIGTVFRICTGRTWAFLRDRVPA
jgi:hypothetical protein